MNPLFSIIAPTLGRLSLWKHALSSVLMQDFKNFELIAVNSHPSTESENLIASLKDARIRYITTSPAEARLNWDVGYRESSGKYILWLDDDNYLLPHALSKLAHIITGYEPEVATGNHIHWIASQHPAAHLRNKIVIPTPFFDHSIIKIDTTNYIRTLFGMSEIGVPTRGRFHFSETAVKREFIDHILKIIGHIDFANTSPRFLQLIFLASTQNAWYVDSPISIIIQMGDSMAYEWSHKEARARRFKSSHTLSPVIADTYINYVTENLLRAKQIFPSALSKFDINWKKFFLAHARELALSEQSWANLFRSMKEIIPAIRKKMPVSDFKIYTSVFKYFVAAMMIKLLRALLLYSWFLKILKYRPTSSKKRRVIDIESYDVNNIEECAYLLPTIIEKELGMPYAKFSGNSAAENFNPSPTPKI